MPIQVTLCGADTGRGQCEGHLNFIVKGKTYTGPQYGDSTDAAFFYQCSSCRKLYYANAGHEIESVRVENIYPYKGKLTAAQLIELAPKHCSGSFGSFDEERMIQALEPKVGDELSATVEKNGIANGYVKLPEKWIGKSVRVILVG